MNGFILINREDLAEVLKQVNGSETTDDQINEFVVVFSNRIDAIIEEEARKFTGAEPPLGFA